MLSYLPDPKELRAHQAVRSFRNVIMFVVWPGMAGIVAGLVMAWLEIIRPADTTGELFQLVFLVTLFAVSLFLVLEGIVSVLVAHVYMGMHIKAGTVRKISPRIRALKVRHDGSRLVPVTDADRFELQRSQDEHLLRLQAEGGYRVTI